MMFWKKAALLLASLDSLARAFALPSSEPFANTIASGGTFYSPGRYLYHQTNSVGEGWAFWNGGTVTSGVICTNGGLSYGNFPLNFPAPSPTNGIYLPGNVDHAGGIAGSSAALNFSRAIAADPNNLTTNAIYASFLLRVPNLGTLNSGGPTYFAGFATNTGDQNISLPASALKLFLKGNSATAGQSTSWSIGVANNSGSGSAAFDAGGHDSNEVVFVVMDYEFGVNGNPDTARLWVNPDTTSFSAPIPPAATGSVTGITGANKIAQAADFFVLDRVGATLWGGLLLSDLRIGTSWSYVTGGADVSPSAGLVLSIAGARSNVTLTGSNGVPGATNFVLTTTNVTLPFANWSKTATNSFDANGHFNLTNSVNTNQSKQFYALQTLPVPDPLWVPECGALLGAACTNATPEAVSNLETQIGRSNDVLRVYHTPGSWSKLSATELAYIAAGRKLMESVKPDSQWSNAVGVANGGSAAIDAQLISLAKSIAAVKPAKIMLIVWHEPENDVIGSVPNANAGTTTQYVQMWHNVRSIFDANGATNVIWCWDVENYAPLRYLMAPLWPGNAYVDWVMWDQYQDSSGNAYTNVLKDGYTFMTTNSNATNNYLGKPWGLAEWGVGINNYIPTTADQTNGIGGLNFALNNNNPFPKIKLVQYFDEGASALLPGAVVTYSNLANSPYLRQQCSH